MIGIYKITSPSKKVYIGQSTSIKKRFQGYKRMNCEKQPKLFNSLKKYGYDKHKFEILCECSIEELNEKERYYQDLYSVLNGKGLNCVLTKSSDRYVVISKETRLKISIASKGRKHSEETKKKQSLAQIGKIVSIETKGKLSIATKNQSIETKIKRAISNTGKKRTQYSKDIMNAKKRALILNLETGIFYEGIKEVASLIELKPNTLKCKLNGQNKNNTQFIYV